MKRHQMISTIAVSQPFGHGANDFLMFIALDRTIPTQYPNNRFMFVALTNSPAVLLGVFLGEDDFRFLGPFWIPFVAPGGQKTDR